jgi:hypothetical protein
VTQVAAIASSAAAPPDADAGAQASAAVETRLAQVAVRFSQELAAYREGS